MRQDNREWRGLEMIGRPPPPIDQRPGDKPQIEPREDRRWPLMEQYLLKQPRHEGVRRAGAAAQPILPPRQGTGDTVQLLERDIADRGGMQHPVPGAACPAPRTPYPRRNQHIAAGHERHIGKMHDEHRIGPRESHHRPRRPALLRLAPPQLYRYVRPIVDTRRKNGGRRIATGAISALLRVAMGPVRASALCVSRRGWGFATAWNRQDHEPRLAVRLTLPRSASPAASSDGWHHVRLSEAVTLESQKLTALPGQGIRKTLSKMQSGWVPPPAKAQPTRKGPSRAFRVHGDHPDTGVLHHIPKEALTLRTRPARDHQGDLKPVRRHHGRIGAIGQGARHTIRLGPSEENTDPRG